MVSDKTILPRDQPLRSGFAKEDRCSVAGRSRELREHAWSVAGDSDGVLEVGAAGAVVAS
ncbi:MAG: hypothetical protein QOJ37_2756 [Pseudonocardiales bacterium]|nr:hypothetical protein [Pseudonocardiales bacterium]